MTARNVLLEAPPFAVEDTLQKLGQRLRTARLRRNLSVAEIGKKIGVGQRAVADAEKGKPSASIATYVALLWAFDMLSEMDKIADPSQDREGLALERRRNRAGKSRVRELDNDF